MRHWLDPDRPLPAPPQGLDWDRVYALLSWHRLTGMFYLQLAEGRTAILISLRFSTVRMADCIYVLEDGRIVESGTHDELVRPMERMRACLKHRPSISGEGLITGLRHSNGSKNGKGVVTLLPRFGN